MSLASPPRASPSAAYSPAVAIILVNYRDAHDTIECLDSLLALDYPTFEVFVIDNDSRDESLQAIAHWCDRPRRVASWKNLVGVYSHTRDGKCKPVAYRFVEPCTAGLPAPPSECKVSLVASNTNSGFAGGCNVGIRSAGQRFDYFWLLNTDTVVDHKALRALVDRATVNSKIGMVGATIWYYNQPETAQALGGASVSAQGLVFKNIGDRERFPAGLPDITDVEAKLGLVLGASILVSNAYFKNVGPIQEDYFLYFEEYDWALRARGAWSLGWARGAMVYHKGGGSSTRTSLHTFAMALRYRNLVRFTARFLPERLPEVRRQLWHHFARYLAQGRWRGIWVVGGALRHFSALAASARPGDVPTSTPLDAHGNPRPVAIEVGL